MKHIDDILPATVENRRVWAHIDLDALVHNYLVSQKYIQEQSPDTPVVAVIKADAYGHGIGPCARVLYNAGCRHFAVACAEEGIAIRYALADLARERAEILILGYTSPAHVALLHQFDMTQTLYSPDYASELHAAAKAAGIRLNVHVKVDTGMHRIGYPAFTPAEAEATVDEICTMQDTFDAFCVQGLFTHLSDADSGNFCYEQWQRYLIVKQGLDLKSGHLL